MVKVMNRIIGIPVKKSAGNVIIALNDVIQNKCKEAVYQWKSFKPWPAWRCRRMTRKSCGI